MKTFTLDEAQALLPVVEALLKRALDSKQDHQKLETELAVLNRRIYMAGGMRVNIAEVARRRAEMETHMERMREILGEMDEIGVQVKDLEAGLLDFPCRVEDEVVLLCWRMGERTIEHWHTMEAGFKGRQPLDERFKKRSSGQKPN
jgi:hypothetical protein